MKFWQNEEKKPIFAAELQFLLVLGSFKPFSNHFANFARKFAIQNTQNKYKHVFGGKSARALLNGKFDLAALFMFRSDNFRLAWQNRKLDLAALLISRSGTCGTFCQNGELELVALCISHSGTFGPFCQNGELDLAAFFV